MAPALDDALLAAHAAGDLPRLVALYTDAAQQAPDRDASLFYLTHAFVFALDAGLSQAADLERRLRDAGRQ